MCQVARTVMPYCPREHLATHTYSIVAQHTFVMYSLCCCVYILWDIEICMGHLKTLLFEVLNSPELTFAICLLSVAICAQALLVLKTNANTDTQNHHIFTICAQFA
jgi:hypothetical protein